MQWWEINIRGSIKLKKKTLKNSKFQKYTYYTQQMFQSDRVDQLLINNSKCIILYYVVIGRIHNSHVVSELVYCLSNLLVLYNDRIITKARQLEIPSSGDALKIWLTVLEYSEVFFELSARKLWGYTGKWIVIVAVQVFKYVIFFIK